MTARLEALIAERDRLRASVARAERQRMALYEDLLGQVIAIRVKLLVQRFGGDPLTPAEVFLYASLDPDRDHLANALGGGAIALPVGRLVGLTRRIFVTPARCAEIIAHGTGRVDLDEVRVAAARRYWMARLHDGNDPGAQEFAPTRERTVCMNMPIM